MRVVHTMDARNHAKIISREATIQDKESSFYLCQSCYQALVEDLKVALVFICLINAWQTARKRSSYDPDGVVNYVEVIINHCQIETFDFYFIIIIPRMALGSHQRFAQKRL